MIEAKEIVFDKDIYLIIEGEVKVGDYYLLYDKNVYLCEDDSDAKMANSTGSTRLKLKNPIKNKQ